MPKLPEKQSLELLKTLIIQAEEKAKSHHRRGLVHDINSGKYRYEAKLIVDKEGKETWAKWLNKNLPRPSSPEANEKYDRRRRKLYEEAAKRRTFTSADEFTEQELDELWDFWDHIDGNAPVQTLDSSPEPERSGGHPSAPTEEPAPQPEGGSPSSNPSSGSPSTSSPPDTKKPAGGKPARTPAAPPPKTLVVLRVPAKEGEESEKWTALLSKAMEVAKVTEPIPAVLAALEFFVREGANG